MDFKLSDYEPIANNWPDLDLRYEGDGSAEFTSPEGIVYGRGTATFDEYGNTSIEIAPESLSVDPRYAEFGLGFSRHSGSRASLIW